MTSMAYGLIIGGAVGNLVDRLLHGAVVDFISFHAAGYYWYVFNIADIWITFGVGLLIIDILFGSEKPEK
jgi:signal peptidase II